MPLAFMATSLGFGYLLTASLNLVLGGFGWRWLFFAGIAPAFLTLYIRTKLKEPENFTRMQEARTEAKNTHKDTRSEAQHELLKPAFSTLISKQKHP